MLGRMGQGFRKLFGMVDELSFDGRPDPASDRVIKPRQIPFDGLSMVEQPVSGHGLGRVPDVVMIQCI